MRAERPADEAEIVLAFLRGELQSPRFGHAVASALNGVGGLDLVTNPDLNSERENEARAKALRTARGWGSGEGLFAGFPSDISWVCGIFDPEELEAIRYINYSYWVALSGGSRKPADVRPTITARDMPEWLENMGTEWCFELADELASVTSVADVLVLTTPQRGELVLLEGHARLTALFVGELVGGVEVRGYTGISPSARQWRLF